MDKLKTRILLISVLLLLLFSVQSVAAVSDDDGNLTSESIDLSICDNTDDVSSDESSNNQGDVLSASNELDVLSADEVSYSELDSEISVGGNIELLHDYYRCYGGESTISISGNNRVIDGRGAVIDMAGSTIRAFNVYGSGITIKNLTIKNANYDGYGGAIYFSSSGTVENCNFTNNTASRDGGAIDFEGTGTVTNCNFVNNSASTHGGAVYFYGEGNVTNCNFVDNKATSYDGGAIYFSSSGTVENCNFTNNAATNGDGGAVYFVWEGTVTNCNFIGNNATYYGGAIYFSSSGTTHEVRNCNFTNNKATGTYSWGGAICMSSGSVENCNFTNNSARYGGAIYFEYGSTGTVENCNFTNNTATNGDGGAICMSSGSVENCNFTNNSARYGGAIEFDGTGTVTNCNFTGNNAITGSAIYFYSNSATKTVSNSRFLNNRANAEDLEVTKNDNNITITFTGQDNLLNAIYSNDEVTFTNVTYWSANGIANTGSSAIKPSRSNREAGQNITVGVVINDVIVLSEVYLTDENGMIVLDISAGENYFIYVRHDTDSYYTEVENITSKNTKFSVNVTSQTTNNKTVNITAKSNIPNEVIKGKLLFILPNSEEISANYGGNRTWWAVHKFDDYGVYEVNASYTGLDNVTVNNGTVTITILKVNTTVSGVDMSGKPDDKKDVTVTVLDYNNNPVANGTVTLTLNGKTYNSTVENGKAVLSVELPNPGEYNATVTYIGNDHYDSSSSSISVNVEKVNTKAPSAEDVSGKAGEKKDIKVKIVDEKGNPVKNGTATLTVDGKTYTAEVIDGVATFKDVVIPDKDTVADVYYHGNDYYNASSATLSIKVEQNNNTEPDSNNTDENKTTKHVSFEIVDANATGNPIAMMLLALCAMVIPYRKK